MYNNNTITTVMKKEEKRKIAVAKNVGTGYILLFIFSIFKSSTPFITAAGYGFPHTRDIQDNKNIINNNKREAE